MSAFEVEYDCTPYIILLRIKLWGIQSAPKPVFRSTNFCMLQISIFEILVFVYCIQWKFFHPVMRYPWFKYNEFVFFSSCGIWKCVGQVQVCVMPIFITIIYSLHTMSLISYFLLTILWIQVFTKCRTQSDIRCTRKHVPQNGKSILSLKKKNHFVIWRFGSECWNLPRIAISWLQL